jgi:accessory gene regulator protein AgrB
MAWVGVMGKGVVRGFPTDQEGEEEDLFLTELHILSVMVDVDGDMEDQPYWMGQLVERVKKACMIMEVLVVEVALPLVAEEEEVIAVAAAEHGLDIIAKIGVMVEEEEEAFVVHLFKN